MKIRDRGRIGGMSLPPDIIADGVDWINDMKPCGPPRGEESERLARSSSASKLFTRTDSGHIIPPIRID